MEVYECGISVYLIDCVVLMILQWLLNGICLLNLYVLCLIMSCEMEIILEGEVILYEIF